ncbi:AAA domain-containing protein [Thalassospira mesophila]|uniref:AAA domain-containing protein n=1 Tax=Thalassospira mesophila TaxID=1293891 RepID=UPI0013026758|nr:AAA domain-containing protein [Thalassospira mesophila]
MVNAALLGEEPFVALACSTNNQAVTNLIDSLGKALLQNSPDPISRRWIPQARSLGLFFPSDKAKERIPKGKYLVAARKGGAFPDEIEHTETRARTEQHFFECFSRYYGETIENPEKIIRILHNDLKTQFNRYSKIVTELEQLEEIRQALEDSRFTDLAEWISSLETETVTLQTTLNACQKTADEEASRAALKQQNARKLQQAAKNEIEPKSVFNRVLNLLPDNRQLRISNLQFLLIDNGYEHLAEKLAQPNFRLSQAMRIFDRLVIEATRLAQLPEAAAQISTLKTNIATLQTRTKQLKKWLSFRIECWTEIAELINQINADTRAAEFEYQHSETLRKLYKNNPEGLIEKLDTLVRNRLFFLASRYWEARWIHENNNIDTNTNLKQTAEHISKRMRRYAMLTPCFVATCYKATATFLVPYKGPLQGFFDMIIMDEAGQVAPEIGGPCLVLGQKAIIIGDTLQIAPIVSVSSAIDRGNLHEAGLLEHKTMLAQNGYTAFEGSMMKMAQHKSCRTLSDGKGMFLAEHRRCYDEIIGYCNRFYNGCLKPVRGPKTDSFLPAMGYAHIRGEARKVQGSWSNKIEAQTIAEWIARKRVKLENRYKTPIDQIIAIVTPFRSQATLIKNELSKLAAANGVHGLKNITVGTVHGLQGAECPVVIFSTVYDFTVSTQYFFNSDNSMLNVAVSRAQDSFLVFGDMQILDASSDPKTNSDHLARIILTDPENEITDILPTTIGIDSQALPLRIETLEQHCDYLRKSFKTAQKNILVYSPYLSDKAINHDKIVELINDASQRGVKVVIAACADHFIPCSKTEQDYARKGRELLHATSAELIFLPRIHNKTLIVDDQHLIEGSFNWFSAPRSKKYDKQEFSNAYSGDDITDTIHRVWQRTLERIPDPSERQRIRQWIFQ